MLFNDLLEKSHIDSAGVLVLRHTPQAVGVKKVLPWLAAESPETFNAYQQTQGETVEAEMLKAKYVASFIGLDRRAGDTAHTAVFIGLYKVGDHRSLTYEQFWETPAFQELKKFGMKGFEGDRPSILQFDLQILDFYKKWQGKMVIEWPRPPIKWWRFADRATFPISAILHDSLLHETMPDWKDCIWTSAELGTLPSKWRDTLCQWRGIYYIFDSDRQGYVGAAYGTHNIWGRWERHRLVGGDAIQLSQRSPDNFVFSILERVSPDMEASEVIDLETTWKKRLHSTLNDN
jgi:hypothetical protein